MSQLSPLVLVLAVAVAVLHGATTGQYSTRLDTVDVDKILSQPRVLSNFVKCVIDKGPCTPEGKDIKKILPEVLATNCAKCSPRLRSNVKKTVVTMREKYPTEWALVVNKYDKNKTHAVELERFLSRKD